MVVAIRKMPSNNKSNTNSFKLVLVIVFVILSFVLMMQSYGSADEEETSATNPQAKSSSAFRDKTVSNQHKDIVKGTLNSVDYYHCGASTTAIEQDTVVDIVLLHGSRFTKEDWKTSKILPLLCLQNRVRVTALDLPTSATYTSMVPLLEALSKQQHKQQPLVKLPVHALVTPSASGRAVVSAIEQGTVAQIAKVTRLWIPVASYGANSLTKEQLQAVVDQQDLNVWAIYGDLDTKGKRVSLKLQQEANADVVEFKGGHPFYLDIPEKFVQELLKKLGVSEK